MEKAIGPICVPGGTGVVTLAVGVPMGGCALSTGLIGDDGVGADGAVSDIVSVEVRLEVAGGTVVAGAGGTATGVLAGGAAGVGAGGTATGVLVPTGGCALGVVVGGKGVALGGAGAATLAVGVTLAGTG